ncbi:nucleoid-associated protein [Turicibacter sanguinis]|uniref:nucleoid-associated protein n=1 Tax=Turicibacter sanguinis TaxID=154288 RepID=UPI00232FB729|nr:nucleoid-associated protein [Turicibacter sanguinis]MDB8437742.1 nucleoid-associated protein [Turicibacter sanguinis]
MTWIKKGYCHLLNNSTSELSLGQHHFDLIGGEFGGFLEKSLDKILKSHDRQPGEFKTNSSLRKLIERYQVGQASLYEVSMTIAHTLYKKREKEKRDDKTALFIMEVENFQSQYIMGLEFKRMEKYQLQREGTSNSVIRNPMLLASVSPKKSPFFTIDLRSLNVSILDLEMKELADILEVELGTSVNDYLREARHHLYNTLTKVEDRFTYFEDIEKSKNEDKINQVNKFEQRMSSMVTNKSLIDFEGIAKDVFIKDRANQKEFLKRLKTAGIPLELKALSNGKVQTRMISLATRLKLSNGIELAIPLGLSEEEVRKGLEEVELTLKGKEGEENES